MKSLWLERVIDSVADRGRDLLSLRGNDKSASGVEKLCLALLSEKGEASGTALARELVIQYEGMTSDERIAFFEMLFGRFGPDEDAIIRAADEFKTSRELDSYLALSKVMEPARQKLFRRINIAPNGIGALVAMRTDLLGALEQYPQFRAVDADLRRLFRSWFNRGFLQLRRIDWRTSAVVLEKLINYESVHEIQSWADLHRRLAVDRRCFAFFHPALPEDPLIFVEAALVNGMSSSIAPLLDEKTDILNPADADSVIFYSINNCLGGLKGISFGNFLIKQVATELAREFPAIKLFSTLSPMPLFTQALNDRAVFSEARLISILGEDAGSMCHAAEETDLMKALAKILADPMSFKHIIAKPLTRLGLAYLACAKLNDRPYDPVAFFHLSNGARLERINAFANTSTRGLEESAGLMVNYRYIPADFEANHEAFVHRQEIALSKKLARDIKNIQESW
jgi:malonyl-CoA decarboxylase